MAIVDTEKLITITHAASLWPKRNGKTGVSREYIFQLIRDEKIAFYNIDGFFFIDKTTIPTPTSNETEHASQD